LIKIIIFIFPISFGWAESPRPTSRLEDLFVWKVSEELKLTVKEEKDFAAQIVRLNQIKAKALDQVELELKKMVFVLPNTARPLLKNYREALKKYNQVSVEEVETMIKVLGPEKAARYFVVKGELAQKIKTLLGNNAQQPEKKGKVKLPEPRLIEE